MKSGFVHLEVKSSHTFGFDSLVRLEKLMQRTKDLGMNAVAITDENVLYSAIDFYQMAKKNSIKPIIGITLKVANGEGRYIKAILLAKNKNGYLNIVKLSSVANLRGQNNIYITKEELLNNKEDLIIMLDLEVQFRNNDIQGVDNLIKVYHKEFGNEDLYFTVKDFGWEFQKVANDYMDSAVKKYGIQLVATNDVNYMNQNESTARDFLRTIQKTAAEGELKTAHQYFKSHDEMVALCSHLPQAIENTKVIAAKCNLVLGLKGEEGFEKRFPNFRVPKDFIVPESLQGKFDIMPGFKKPQSQYEVLSIAYLCHLAETELLTLYGDSPSESIKSRLRYELGVIISKGFTNYFLIVQDFMKYARLNGIIVGPGRGSAAGSLVSYCLRITDVDPIQYNLMFERFLNPERTDDPDIDIDISTEFRYKLYEYAQAVYGYELTAKVITFNNFGGKTAILDVGKALKIDDKVLSKLASLVIKSINELLGKEDVVNPLLEKNPKIAKLIEIASQIEGLPKNRSIHPAGLVLSDRNLSEDFPVMMTIDNDSGKPILITQFHKDILETVGITKIDLLGLRNLDIVDKVKKAIKKTQNVILDHVPLDDLKTFELYQKGETVGVFQMDSKEMRATSQKIKPTKIDDIFPLIALFRPGSMDMIPIYAKNRANNDFTIYDMNETYDENKKQMIKTFVPFDKDVAILKPILNLTYGVIVFQEQIIRIVQTWAGFSVGEADILRRTISKKRKEEMEEKKILFCQKSKELNRDEETTERLFELIVKFANYGFNVPHSAAYGILSYTTAYLKANYPLEFMSANLSSLRKNPKKLVTYLEETIRMGIQMSGPSVNTSFVDFEVDKNGISYGLSFVKDIGRKKSQDIVQERTNGKFLSLKDFLIRVKSLNQSNVITLIKAGAFDEFGSRKALIGYLQNNNKQNAFLVNQVTFDAIPGIGLDHPQEIPTEEYTIEEKMTFEKELLNITHTQYLAQKYEKELKFAEKAKNYLNQKESVWFGGSLTSVKRIKDSKGNEMAFLKFSDGSKVMDVAVFYGQWEKFKKDLQMFDMYMVELSKKNDKYSILNWEKFIEKRQVVIEVPQSFVKEAHLMKEFALSLKDNKGMDELVLKIGKIEKIYMLKATKSWVEKIEALGIPKENIKYNKVRYV